MINFEAYKDSLNSHITYFEKHYSNDEKDKQEVQSVQRDLGYKLDKIIENYDVMEKDNIKCLLAKIAKINRLMGDAK